jgi:hypothetical protein
LGGIGEVEGVSLRAGPRFEPGNATWSTFEANLVDV